MSLEADVGKPLLDVLRDVVLDPAEQAAFTADPATYLAEYGYDDVSPDDLSEAFGLVADTLPPDVAQAVAAAAPPASSSSGLVPDADEGFAVGEGDGATFGEVNGDFDAVALGGPDTLPSPDDGADELDPDLRFDGGDMAGEAPPEGDHPDAFGEGSDGVGIDLAGDDLTDFAPDLGVEAAAPVEAEVDVAEWGGDYPDEGLGGPDTFPDDVDDLGEHPSDFIDDVGSF